MQGIRVANTGLHQGEFSYQGVIFAFFILLFLALAYIWSHVSMRQTEYRIAAEKSKTEQLREEQKRLQLEYAPLKSPKRIEEIAKRDLRMRYPKPEQVVSL